MKKILFLLAMFFAGFASAQDSECIIPLTLADGDSTSILLGMHQMKYAIPEDGGSLIFAKEAQARIKVLEPIDSLVSFTNGNMFTFTDNRRNYRVAMSRHYVNKVLSGAGGRAVIVTNDVRTVFETQELFATITPLITTCAGGAGGGGAYVGQNLGAGEGQVYSTTTSNIHQFRTLKEGAGIDIVTSGDLITITSLATGDSTVSTDATIDGTGTVANPLGLADNAVSTVKIQDDAVTYNKIQNVTSQRLLGRASLGAGSVEEIELGSNLSFDGTTLNASVSLTGLIQRYDAGDGCWVTASGPGCSFVMSTGSGTLSVPDTVELLGFRVSGETADLLAGNFTVILNHDPAVLYNQDVSTYYPPVVQVVNTTGQLAGGPSAAAPFIFDEGSNPQAQIVQAASGDLHIRVISLTAFSNWSILGSF